MSFGDYQFSFLFAKVVRETAEQYSLLMLLYGQIISVLILSLDGAIVENDYRLGAPDQMRLCQYCRQLIASHCRCESPFVLIAKKAGIVRDFFWLCKVGNVNQRMQKLLKEKAPSAAIFANGYWQDALVSSWRKRISQMFLEAVAALNFDLHRLLPVCDRLSDLKAGVAFGLAILFHVLSGHSYDARGSLVQWQGKCRAVGEIFSASECQLMDSLKIFPFPLLKQGTSALR